MVQSHPSKKRLPKAAHRPKRYRLGLHVLRQNLPDFQMVHNVDRPWGSHDRHANAASLFEWTSALIQLFSTKSKINGNSEMKHSTAAMTPHTHSSVAHYSVLKLLDFMPKLGLSWHSIASSYHDHSPLS
jgi:hypothetical protein